MGITLWKAKGFWGKAVDSPASGPGSLRDGRWLWFGAPLWASPRKRPPMGLK